MRVDRCDATLGAIVTNVDLARLSDAEFAAIEEVWDEHAVLVFPAQDLSSDDHLAFSRRLGRLEMGLVQNAENLLGHISNTDRDGNVLPADSVAVRFGQGNEQWHTDSSYKRVGAKASLLRARRVPSWGGETEWADMRAAYDVLDAETKSWLEGKIAVHSYRYSHAWHGGLEILDDDALAGLSPVQHALVKTHPKTGRKNLFVGRHASHIIGEDEADSRERLQGLTAAACRPPRVYKHTWRPGDLVLWDNRCVLHRGHPYPLDEARDMIRTTVAGDDADNEWAVAS